jgi:hypothetical protein
VTSDKPTAEEAGAFAVWIAENVKEGDRVLLIGRLAGSKDGRANLYTNGREVRASYLHMSVTSLSITEKKANRVVKPAPPETGMPLQVTAIPVASSSRPALPVTSTASRPALPTFHKLAAPVVPSNLPLPPTPKPVGETNLFARFKNPDEALWIIFTARMSIRPLGKTARRLFFFSKIQIQFSRSPTMAKSNHSAVPSASLAKALSTVARASGKDPYQMVHVQAENGKLSVRCFNGLMGILAIIAAEDKGNAFDATIDAQAFASLVSSMNGAVTLSPSGRNGLQVQSGSVDVTLKGINKTLPEFEDKEAKKVLTINGQDPPRLAPCWQLRRHGCCPRLCCRSDERQFQRNLFLGHGQLPGRNLREGGWRRKRECIAPGYPRQLAALHLAARGCYGQIIGKTRHV